MIKGVLIEKRKSYAIVLTEEGDFQKTKPVNHVEIGKKQSYHHSKSANPLNR